MAKLFGSKYIFSSWCSCCSNSNHLSCQFCINDILWIYCNIDLIIPFAWKEKNTFPWRSHSNLHTTMCAPSAAHDATLAAVITFFIFITLTDGSPSPLHQIMHAHGHQCLRRRHLASSRRCLCALTPVLFCRDICKCNTEIDSLPTIYLIIILLKYCYNIVKKSGKERTVDF